MKTILKYEQIINEALRSALDYETPDEEINEFIRFFGKHIHSDRIYIFEDDCDNHVTNNTYEWCADRIIPQIDALQGVDMDVIGWWYETFDSGKSVIIPDVSILEGNHRLSYQILKAQNIKNLVVCPLRYKGEIRGFFGVDNPPERDYEALTVFLDMIGAVLISLLKIRNSFRKSNYEAKLSSYSALAEIYLLMSLIDLKTGRFKIIKSNKFIDECCDKNEKDNYSRQIGNVIKRLCLRKYHEEIATFTDVSTLEERLENCNTVAHVFKGKISGWCRERFIKVDNDEEGKLWHVLYCIEDIDKEKTREDRLIYLSEIDSMTGVCNRGSGERKISRLLEAGVGGMLLLIDCDKFKSINDTYGHIVGDAVIIAIAETLQKVCGPRDIVMRLGGDEFAMFIPKLVGKEEAEAFFKQLFTEISQIYIAEMGDRKIYVSLGAAICEENQGATFDELYRKMDSAMYESKKVEGYCARIY
jgi:diguanylate cyclase (GGDEF)-like protein